MKAAKSLSILALLTLSAFLFYSPAIQAAHATGGSLIQKHYADATSGTTVSYTLAGNTSSGDVIVVQAGGQWDVTLQRNCPISISDTAHVSWFGPVSEIGVESQLVAGSGTSACSDIFYGVSKASGDVITVTYNRTLGGGDTGGQIYVYDTRGYTVIGALTGTGASPEAWDPQLSANIVPPAGSFVMGTAMNTYGLGGSCSPGPGYTCYFAGEYSVNFGGTTKIPISGGYYNVYASAYSGIALQLCTGYCNPTFTAKILNLDCGNCVLAGNGKFYEFQVNMTSNAVSATPGNFTSASLYFNDGVHFASITYDFATTITSVGAGSDGIITAGSTSLAKDIWSKAFQVSSVLLDFYILFTSIAVQSAGNSLKLEACTKPDNATLGSCTGEDTVQSDYFDIINQGGVYNYISSGLCAHTGGQDVFAQQCNYKPGSLTQANDTYAYLQSYSTQFSIAINENTSTGAATNWNTNGGSLKLWQSEAGFYYWDNSTWVLGPSVVFGVLNGKVDSTHQFVNIVTEYYFGSTLISNQTINVWPQPAPLGTIQLYVDIWYSTINASTTWGMRVNAYYVGMSESCFLTCLWGGSWTPTLNNQSTSQAFGTLYNHAGKVISSTLITCTDVFWATDRPVRGAVTNFRVQSENFNIEQFNLAGTPSQMGGVATPIYTQPLIPTVSSGSSFFSPLYAAIASIAGFFAKALTSLGDVVWSALGSRFPWLTGYISAAGSLLVQLFNLLFYAVAYIVQILSFMYAIVGYILIPISIVTNAWSIITGIYNAAFRGVPLPEVIEVFVIIVFGLSIMEALFTGDFGYIVRLARGVWGIVDTLFVWTWSLAKFLADVIEGLIP